NIDDDELLNYLDGMGTEAEREFFRNKLNNNSIAKKRMEELQAVHQFFQKQKGIEQPSKNFTEKVMAGLHSKTSLAMLSPKNGLLLLLGLAIASGIAITLVSSGLFDQ